MEKHSDCKFFHRIDLDAEGFDIFLEISKIQHSLNQTKKNEKKKKNSK